LTIKIRQVNGDPDINLPPVSASTTVAGIKSEIEKMTQVPVVAQRLIYKGKILQDTETMEFHQVKNGETFVFQVVKKLLAEAQAVSSSSQAQAPTSPQQQQASSSPAAAVQAAVPATGAATTTATNTGPPEMIRAMDFLCSSNSQDNSHLALNTLLKVIDNIITHPQEPKYQKIKKSNAVFQRKLGGVVGGEACILAAGFTDDGEGSYALTASAEAWDHINACRDCVAVRVQSLAPVASVANPPAIPNFMNAPMMGDPAADLRTLAANPQALQQVWPYHVYIYVCV
jgi:hypothetical protein